MGHAIDVAKRYWFLAWPRRWWAVAALWATCVGGWAGVALLPNQYEAGARVYIDADAVLTPLLKGITVDSSMSDEIDLLQNMMLSRPNLERIIGKTDLQLQSGTRNDMELMVNRLLRSIKVVPQARNIFTISYRSPRRQLAFDVVQAVLASFIENKAGDNREEMEKASAFLDGQIDNYERQLREAEVRRADFRKKYVDLLPGDSGVNRLEQARAAVSALSGQLTDALSRKAVIARELAITKPTVVTDAASAADTGQALRAAEAKLRDLEEVYTAEYPEVVSQRREVAQLRGAAAAPQPAAPAAGGRSAPNPVFEQLKLRAVETDATIASLRRQVLDGEAERDRLDGIARGAPGLEAQYVNLNRDYDILRKNYDELVSRREGMRISTKAEISSSNVKMVIIDPPQVPQQPVAPARVAMSVGVLVAGIAAAAGVLVMFVTTDTSIHTMLQLRAIGLPVIGSISLAAAPSTFGDRLKGGAAVAASLAVLATVFLGVLLRASGRA